MAGIKKDNHYVPQAYLKQWLINGKILTYRLLVPHKKWEHWKAHSPKSIAKHQHLYTYFSGSKDSDEIENWLDRDFERPASVSIAKVVKEAQLNVEDWNNLFRFAVAQSIRTPTGMQSFMRRQSQTLKVLLSESLEGSVAKVEASLASGVKLNPAPPVDPFSKLPLKLHRVNNEDGSEGIEALVLNGGSFGFGISNTSSKTQSIVCQFTDGPSCTPLLESRGQPQIIRLQGWERGRTENLALKEAGGLKERNFSFLLVPSISYSLVSVSVPLQEALQ